MTDPGPGREAVEFGRVHVDVAASASSSASTQLVVILDELHSRPLGGRMLGATGGTL